jgi:hypothetical protein
MRLEGVGKFKKCSDLTGNRTRKLPACSIVPQRTTLPRAPYINIILLQLSIFGLFRMLHVSDIRKYHSTCKESDYIYIHIYIYMYIYIYIYTTMHEGLDRTTTICSIHNIM